MLKHHCQLPPLPTFVTISLINEHLLATIDLQGVWKVNLSALTVFRNSGRRSRLQQYLCILSTHLPFGFVFACVRHCSQVWDYRIRLVDGEPPQGWGYRTLVIFTFQMISVMPANRSQCTYRTFIRNLRWIGAEWPVKPLYFASAN